MRPAGGNQGLTAGGAIQPTGPYAPKWRIAMTSRARHALSPALACMLAVLLPAAPGLAGDGRLTVELNKFEEAGEDGCRAFFLFRNATGQTLTGFEMSLAILDRDGVIDRLLTIDAAPLPAARTTLKLFDIPETRCDAIGEILLHDIPACQPQDGTETDCFALLDLVSRTGAAMVN